jgi:hypothetical protein
MVLEPAPGDIEGLFQDEPEVFLGTVPRHGDLLAPYLQIDAESEMISSLVMTMGDVGDHVAGDDARAECIELFCAPANLGFNCRIGCHPWKGNRQRLPHARLTSTH